MGEAGMSQSGSIIAESALVKAQRKRRAPFQYGGRQHTFHGTALCLLQWFKRYKVTIMPRTFPRLTLSIALLACVGAAYSQAASQTAAQAAPTGQPPATERIEPESETPATNIESRRGTQIREKRNNSGQVTEVEVQSGRSRYVMKSGQPAGNAQAGDAQSSAIRAPQWQVMEFDLNAKRKAAAEAQAAAAEAAAGAAAPVKTSATASATAAANRAPATSNIPAATVPMTKPADIPPPPPLPTTR